MINSYCLLSLPNCNWKIVAMDATKVCRVIVSIFLMFQWFFVQHKWKRCQNSDQNTQLAEWWDSATLQVDKSRTQFVYITCKPFCKTSAAQLAHNALGKGQGALMSSPPGQAALSMWGDLPAPYGSGCHNGIASRFTMLWHQPTNLG